MGKNKYGRLFAPVEDEAPDSTAQKQAEEAGPAAVPVRSPTPEQKQKAPANTSNTTSTGKAYRFKPEIGLLVNPDPKSIEAGTDIHALHSGWCSVTPIRATFALGDVSSRIETEEGAGKGLWKL
jgi:broad specificity polyphosphatase/5'/3'-nucleotidase SurE